jgi:uncharacterized protein YdhG (YjbR/CyaY superfamily)
MWTTYTGGRLRLGQPRPLVERMWVMAAKKSGAGRGDAASEGFTPEERAAMKERAQEVRDVRRRGAKADREDEVLQKISEMPEPDRGMAQRVHEIVRAIAPELTPRLWYGMPAYAKGGKVLCFFQAASKFGARYATLGFDQTAALDDGDMWPTAFALLELTPSVESRIAELVTTAVG